MNWIAEPQSTTVLDNQTKFVCVIDFCGGKPCSPVLCNTKSFPK